jgi:hypothetical protein
LNPWPSKPALALMFGAATWGIIWYPFRLLAQAGIDGVWSTLITYGLGLAFAVVAFPRIAASLLRAPPLAYVMALTIGWSNLAYVLGVLQGEVMRVLLLFYLAPLWTVPLARLILHERLDARGLAVMAIAFAGAMIMLWHPAIGVPWPASRAEWLGVGAGFCFALGNVLVRKLDQMDDVSKSIAILAGVTVICDDPRAAELHGRGAGPLRRTHAAAGGAGNRCRADRHGPVAAIRPVAAARQPRDRDPSLRARRGGGRGLPARGRGDAPPGLARGRPHRRGYCLAGPRFFSRNFSIAP